MTELYVTGVVIANGIPDSDGDILNKKEIKQIFTKYTVQQTDTQHNYIRNEGVDVLENWITETPTVIGGKSVPAGSWLCTTKVTNEDLCNLLLEQKVNSYSLGSTPKSAILPVINKGMTYSEVADVEEIQPLFISFVNKGANGYTFEVMSYDCFINKNDKNQEEDKMTENKVDIPIEDEKISIGAIQKLRDVFGINKSDDTLDAVEPQQEVKIETEPSFDKDELMAEIDTKISEGVAKGIKAYKEEEAKLKAETQNEEEEPEEKEEEVEEVKVDDDHKINKEDKSTVKTEEVTVPETNTNFYKMSGRDSFGCKIRK